MGGSKITVIVVDDHPIFCRGLALSFAAYPDIEVLAELGSAAALREAAKHAPPDVAVIDVVMPNMNGLSLVQELRELAPKCRVLGLSMIDEPCVIADMLRVGASGYALKRQPIEEVVDAVRTISNGERYLPPHVTAAEVDAELARRTPSAFARLTAREREVLELLIRGYGNGEIAARLFIALRTVETHRQRIVKKLSARTVTELQRVVARHGGIGL